MAAGLWDILWLKSMQYFIACLVLGMVGWFWCHCLLAVIGGVDVSWCVHFPLSYTLMLDNNGVMVKCNVSFNHYVLFSRPIYHITLRVIAVSEPVALISSFFEFLSQFIPHAKSQSIDCYLGGIGHDLTDSSRTH